MSRAQAVRVGTVVWVARFLGGMTGDIAARLEALDARHYTPAVRLATWTAFARAVLATVVVAAFGVRP